MNNEKKEKKDTIEGLLKRIDMVDCHIRTFAQSFPRILKDSSLYTQSHLIVVRECLPYLRRLLAYMEESIPLVNRMSGIAATGTSDLSRASKHLDEIDQSSEKAVQDILDVMEEVRTDLDEAAAAEDCGPQAKEKIDRASTALFSMMEALQFQDITSQRVRATNALLAKLDQKLGSLVEGMDHPEEVETIKVISGTFDPNTVYDREQAAQKQEEVDALVESLGNGKPKDGAVQKKVVRKKKKAVASSGN